MYSQLRKTYPKASIVSKILEITPDRIIVECTISDEFLILSTALGSASNVEDAEDSAKCRCLLTLGLEGLQEESEDKDFNNKTKGEVPKILESDFVSSWLEPLKNGEAKVENTFFGVELAAKKERDTEAEELIEKIPQDFSEIIARTNVELKRLAWTNQQGRDYLLETYGKRSRQLLTDEELLEFLGYLEALRTDGDEDVVQD